MNFIFCWSFIRMEIFYFCMYNFIRKIVGQKNTVGCVCVDCLINWSAHQRQYGWDPRLGNLPLLIRWVYHDMNLAPIDPLSYNPKHTMKLTITNNGQHVNSPYRQVGTMWQESPWGISALHHGRPSKCWIIKTESNMYNLSVWTKWVPKIAYLLMCWMY